MHVRKLHKAMRMRSQRLVNTVVAQRFAVVLFLLQAQAGPLCSMCAKSSRERDSCEGSQIPPQRGAHTNLYHCCMPIPPHRLHAQAVQSAACMHFTGCKNSRRKTRDRQTAPSTLTRVLLPLLPALPLSPAAGTGSALCSMPA